MIIEITLSTIPQIICGLKTPPKNQQIEGQIPHQFTLIDLK